MGDVRTYVVCIWLFVIICRCWSLSVAIIFAVRLWSIVLVIRRSWLRVTVVGRDRGRVVVVQRHGGCVVVVVVVASGRGCIMTRGDLPV